MQLTATKRESTTKAKALRDRGLIPANIYGPKQESLSITLNRKDFTKVFSQAGESTVVNITGLDGEMETLIHEVDYDPVSSLPVHVDFYAIEKGKTVTVAIPLTFDGVSPAVKDLGGILVKVMHEIEIEALPKDLPQSISVDITLLKELTDQVKVKDLKFPSSAKVDMDEDEVVAMISVAKEEEPEPVAADISQVGISVEKGKKEVEGEPAPEKKE